MGLCSSTQEEINKSVVDGGNNSPPNSTSDVHNKNINKDKQISDETEERRKLKDKIIPIKENNEECDIKEDKKITDINIEVKDEIKNEQNDDDNKSKYCYLDSFKLIEDREGDVERDDSIKNNELRSYPSLDDIVDIKDLESYQDLNLQFMIQQTASYKLAIKLLTMFIDDITKSIRKLKRIAKYDEHINLIAVAHALKGSSSMVGLEKIHEITAKLVSIGRYLAFNTKIQEEEIITLVDLRNKLIHQLEFHPQRVTDLKQRVENDFQEQIEQESSDDDETDED